MPVVASLLGCDVQERLGASLWWWVVMTCPASVVVVVDGLQAFLLFVFRGLFDFY